MTELSYGHKILNHGSWGWMPIVQRSDGRKRRCHYRKTMELAQKACAEIEAKWRSESP